MRALITGSTTWLDREVLQRELRWLLSTAIIVTGDTSGADAMAIAGAHELGLAVETMW